MLTEADVPIHVIIVIKHAPKMLHGKEVYSELICCCRCNIKIKYMVIL